MSLFKPKQILDRFTQLDIDDLKNRGFKAVFIDVDNTITAPGSGELTEEANKFINDISKVGLKPIIVSNNTKKRVEMFIGDSDVEYTYWAMKPLPFTFKRLAKKNGYDIRECVAIGDQLLTDILGANLSGCYGIYSKQLEEKDTPLTKINRRIEKLIWRYILHEKV